MRLCLVSSILALLVIILAEHRAGFGLVLLVLAMMVLMYLWRITSYYSSNKILSLKAFFQHQKLKNTLIILISTLLTALYCYSWLESRLDSRLPAKYSGERITGVADVVSCDYSNSSIEKFVLELVSVDQTQAFLIGLRKVSVSHYLRRGNSTKILINDADTQQHTKGCGFRIKFNVKLRAPYSFINPVGFDYEAWLLSKGIDATGYFIDYTIIPQEGGLKQSSIQSSIQSLTQTLKQDLINFRQQGVERAAALPGLSGQVVPALLFGVSGYLDKARWADLQMTGAIHLLVVSGLHVGFLVLMIVLIWRLFIQLEVLVFHPSHSYLLRLTPLVLMICCLAYAYMAGLGLAVQRSSLMLLITIVVSYYKSHWSLLDTWLWVTWLVLIINPLASLSIGFWFSFAAVGGLLITHVGGVQTDKKQALKTLTPKSILTDVSMWRNALGYLLRPQWIVFITLMPFLWIFQQSQSLWSLVVNTFAIPLLALCILPLSLLALVLPNSFVPEVLNHVLSFGFESLQLIATDSSWLVFKSNGLWLLALITIVVTLLMFKGFPFRRLSLFILAMVYLLPFRAVEERFVVFDVGQGLSVSGVFPQQHELEQLREDGESSLNISSWVYDTGAKFRSGFSLGEAVVAKNLLAQPISKLDMLFISHSDNDHAGGEAGLKRVVDVGKTYAGQPSRDDHINCHSLSVDWNKGQGFKWRIFTLTEGGSSLKDNDLSCVIQFEIRGVRILMPGDIEQRVEEKLVQNYGDQLRSEVLIAPHHGSNTSSSEGFLKHVAPDMAIISSGFKNPFRHPHTDVVERYKNLGISVYNTAYSGAVELKFSSNTESEGNNRYENYKNINVIEWRKLNPPIWRQM